METCCSWLLLDSKRQNKIIKPISYVAFRINIYKHKMLCRLDYLSETAYNLYNHVKKYIINENEQTKYLSILLIQWNNYNCVACPL